MVGVVDDHVDPVDGDAFDTANKNFFLNTQIHGHSGSGSHWAYSNGNLTYSAFNAKTNVTEGSIASAAFVPDPVVVS